MDSMANRAYYMTPSIVTYPLYDKFLDEYNVLIAGTIGSGKSVTENGIIYGIANSRHPVNTEIYLIDPKMVELDPWRTLPHVRGYADTLEGSLRILDHVIAKMMDRYVAIKERQLKEYQGGHVYVFIDEMADLMIQDKKAVSTRLQRIMQLGRAARIHLICCTQSASRVTIPAAVAIGFTCKVGLHAATEIESRQVIGKKGCEALPLYGQAIIKWQNGTYEKVAIPMYTEQHYAGMRRYYADQAPWINR